MAKKEIVAPIIGLEDLIHEIREQKVILDADLARIYGVTTKRLNEQVKRNRERFPADFAFQLTAKESVGLRSQIATGSSQEADSWEDVSNRSQFATGSQKHRDPRFRPYAFTEHGAVMMASVLNSPIAIEASVQVVRAFVRLRELLATHKDLAHKLEALEKKYDSQFKVVFEAIRELMAPPEEPPKPPIGFKT